MIITKKCRIKNWDESNISPLQMIKDRILIDQNNINFVVDQLNSKKINITCVPSILVIYEDGGVEKYENTDAFNWVEEIIKRSIFLQKQQEESQNSLSNVKEQELYLDDDTHIEPIINDIISQQQPVKSQPKYKNQSKNKSDHKIQTNKNKQKQNKNNKIPTNKTSIEDLEDLEDLDIDLEDDDIQENFEFKSEPIEQIESTNALSEKRNDLLSLAAEMQKSRDNFVETTDKPKIIPFNR